MTLRIGLVHRAWRRVFVANPKAPEKVVENHAVAEGVLIEEKLGEKKNEEGKKLVKVVGGVQDAVLR